MLIKEPQLICDICAEPISKGSYVCFVYKGPYDGIIDNYPYLESEDEAFHFHVTCYDEKGLTKNVPSIR